MELEEDLCCDEELCCIDETFTIYEEFYKILKQTISHNVEKDREHIPFNFDQFISMLVQLNLNRNEDDLWLTTGPYNKIYVCGKWLYRPIHIDGKKMSTMQYLQSKLNNENIIFLPRISGKRLRKKIWYVKGEKPNSFNIPRKYRIDTFRDSRTENPFFTTRRKTFRHIFSSILRLK